MPSLHQLICNVKDIHSKQAFKEYEIKYEDGVVTCYCLVPDKATDISVNVRSTGYLPSGLAIFVYIDGIYQTNRNQCWVPPSADRTGVNHPPINLEVNQREFVTEDGTILASGWTVHPLSQDMQSSVTLSPESLGNENKLSTIEVVAVRCGRDLQGDNLSAIGPEPSFDMVQVSPEDGIWRYQNSSSTDINLGAQASLSFLFGATNDHLDDRSFNRRVTNVVAPPVQSLTSSLSLPFLVPSCMTMDLFQTYCEAHPHLSIDAVEAIFDKLSINRDRMDRLGLPKSEPNDSRTIPSGSVEPSLEVKQHLQKFNATANGSKDKPTYSHVTLIQSSKPYYHSHSRPDYLDKLEKPFAKFVFHYRNRDTLETCTGKPIDTALEDAQVQYANKSKDDIIEEYVAFKKTAHLDGVAQARAPGMKVEGKAKAEGKPQSTVVWGSKASSSQADGKKHESPNNTTSQQVQGQVAPASWEIESNRSDSLENDTHDSFNQSSDDQNQTEWNQTDNDKTTESAWGAGDSSGWAQPDNSDKSWDTKDQSNGDQSSKNDSSAWPTSSVSGQKDSGRTDKATDAWGGDRDNSASPVGNGTSNTNPTDSMHQRSSSMINPMHTIIAYMVQIPPLPNPSTIQALHGERVAAQASDIQVSTSATTNATPRRRARAESFYTTRSATEILDETNEQPGYGAIDAYERLMMQRDQRTRRLQNRAASGNLSSVLPSGHNPLPSNPHLEPFPIFNQAAIDAQNTAQTQTASFSLTHSAAIANTNPTPPSSSHNPVTHTTNPTALSPSSSHSPVRGRTMHRRSDAINQANIERATYSPFSRVPRSSSSSSTSSSDSGSATPRPTTRVVLRPVQAVQDGDGGIVGENGDENGLDCGSEDMDEEL